MLVGPALKFRFIYPCCEPQFALQDLHLSILTILASAASPLIRGNLNSIGALIVINANFRRSVGLDANYHDLSDFGRFTTTE